MKYEGQRPSGVDKDIPLFIIAIGKQELDVLRKAVIHIKDQTPKITETQIFRARLSTILKQLTEVWRIAKDTKQSNP